MSVGVEVPLSEDEREALRVMLQAPGYRALMRLEDGYIAALDAAPILMGKMDAHNPDIPKAFLRANVAREFRDIVHAEVIRIANEVRRNEARDGAGAEQVENPFEVSGPGSLTWSARNENQLPTLVEIVKSKYRR